MKALSIIILIVGLFLIAKSGKKEKINYASIVLPLIIYLCSKFGYGFVLKAYAPVISPAMAITPALFIVALICIPKVHFSAFKNKKGTLEVSLIRIPNVLGDATRKHGHRSKFSDVFFDSTDDFDRLILHRIIEQEESTDKIFLDEPYW